MFGIDTFLTVMIVLYVINILTFGFIIPNAKYPRVTAFSQGGDIIRLIIMIAMLIWVVNLK